jgi:phosphoribosylpyrophosphate synthetase
MEIKKYPDGTSYVVLSEEDKISYNFTFKINTYTDLHHLEQLVEVCNFQGKTPTITIPCLIDAQADRRFDQNHSSGLKIVLKRLNSMDAKFKIFHPHNSEVVEAMMDNVEIIDNSKFIGNSAMSSTVLGRLLTKFNGHTSEVDKDNLILMSSDAGGFKPLMKLCDKINWKGETFSASKARTNTGLKQLIDRKDFNGKDILIIDDICVYGGTFKGLAKLLKELNCGKLYLAVSHMTIQDLGEDSIEYYYDKIFTTNSKFGDNYFKTQNGGEYSCPGLKIINLFNYDN